jgi:hypothetical protein
MTSLIFFIFVFLLMVNIYKPCLPPLAPPPPSTTINSSLVSWVVGLIFSFCWKGCFACRGVGFGLMESRFFVEAKSFRFSVETGSAELRVEEKRKGFSGSAVFGLSCTAWMLSKVEEVLGNPGIEDFVKSFREGSKVTITRRGENRSGRFLEVAVFDGGRRGRILFPEGRDGRGWSRVSRELSKILDFLGTTVGSPTSGGLPSSGGFLLGVKLGKGTGRPSFAEVVSSAATVSGNRVAAKIVGDWPLSVRCDVEKTQLRGMEMGAVRQVRECSVLEEQAVGPSGMDHRVDDHFRSRGCVCRPAGVSRDSAVEGDVSLQGDGVFGVFEKVFEILGRFSKALVWACGFSKKLGSSLCLGLNVVWVLWRAGCLRGLSLVLKGFGLGLK